MTTSHKVVLSLIATICITLIVFYSVKGNQQNTPQLAIASQSPATNATANADDRPVRDDAATKTAPMETPIIVGRSENNRATGLDDLVAKVRSEVTANDTAVASATNSNQIPPLVAITDTAASNATASTPAATDTAASDATTLDATISLATGEVATNTTSTPASSLDVTTPSITPSITPSAPSSTDSDASSVPSFTLGEPLESPLTTGGGNSIASRPISPTDDRARDDQDAGTGAVKDGDFADLAIVDDADAPLVKVSGETDDSTSSDAASSAGQPSRFSDATGSPLLIDPHKPAASATTDDTPSLAKANTRADSKIDETRASPNAQAIAPSTPDTTKPKPEAPAATMRTYTIKAGDSFSSIATAIYGAERHWIDIADANPTIDPKRVRIGQTINLPNIDKEDDKPATATATPRTDAAAVATPKVEPSQLEKLRADAAIVAAAGAAAQVKTHEVAAGENLTSISRKYYNTPDHWRHVYLTNRQTIGSDPGKLHVGMKLKITPVAKE